MGLVLTPNSLLELLITYQDDAEAIMFLIIAGKAGGLTLSPPNHQT
jgi:hypothetical protein